MKFFILYYLLPLLLTLHLKIESSISNSNQLCSVFGYEKNLVYNIRYKEEDIEDDLNTGTSTLKAKKKEKEYEENLPNKDIFSIQKQNISNITKESKDCTIEQTNTAQYPLIDNQLQFEGKYFMLTKEHPKNRNKNFKNIAGNEIFNFLQTFLIFPPVQLYIFPIVS